MKNYLLIIILVIILLFCFSGCGDTIKTLDMEVINLDTGYSDDNIFVVNTNDFRILVYNSNFVHYDFNIGDKIKAKIISWYELNKNYNYESFKIVELYEVNGIKINNKVED